MLKGDSYLINQSIHVRHLLDYEAFSYLKRVIVTTADYPSLVEFIHFDIQSTDKNNPAVFDLLLSVCDSLITQTLMR